MTRKRSPRIPVRPPRAGALGLALVLAVGWGAAAHAGHSAPPRREELTVEARDDLRFGTVAREGAGRGWIEVAPSGAGGIAAGGGLVGLGGDRGPAEFRVTGEPYAAFHLALPGRVRLAKGVVVKRFTADPEWFGVLDGDGRATVRVGGRLVVRERAVPRSHRAAFTIEVAYE